MAMSPDDKLIYMADQIARNFEAIGHDHAVAATQDHMLKYWDPRMKARVIALAGERPGALGRVAAAAVARLRAGIVPPSQTPATRFSGADEPGASDAG